MEDSQSDVKDGPRTDRWTGDGKKRTGWPEDGQRTDRGHLKVFPSCSIITHWLLRHNNPNPRLNSCGRGCSIWVKIKQPFLTHRVTGETAAALTGR
jgi:hypothetical protein